MRPFVFLGVLLTLIGCGHPEPSRVSSLQLLDLDGQPFDLWKLQQDAITVVLFTRTDCPIANRCAPEYCRLYDKYNSLGVKFFLIYIDPLESVDAIRRHVHEYGYQCPALRDSQHTFVAHCNATTTPEAVVFKKDRSIAYAGRVDDLYLEVGKPRAEATTHDLADAIESTLHGQPVANPRTKAIGCLIADLKD